MERKRQIDPEKLSDEQIQQLSDQIGGKLREICDKACEEANRILSVYNMQARMQIELTSKEFDEKQGD
jgi:hypothetical protein